LHNAVLCFTNTTGGTAMLLDDKFFEKWKAVKEIAVARKKPVEELIEDQYAFYEVNQKAQEQFDNDKPKINKVLDEPDSKDLTPKDIIAKAGAHDTQSARNFINAGRQARRKKLETNGR
jgi:hypothetical protein